MKQMLQGANADLFNPLVPKAHNIDRDKYEYLFYWCIAISKIEIAVSKRGANITIWNHFGIL